MRKVLSNPIVGFAPWIAMAILASPDRFELAAGVALALAIALAGLGAVAGTKPKLLDLVGILFFGALLVAGVVVDDGGLSWLERWAGELSNVAIALVALFSIAIKTPFTIQYAREQVPREFWAAPQFIRINYVITWAWTAAFLVSAIAGYIGTGPLDDPNNFWTSWVLQVGVLIAAIKFTAWYPDHATGGEQDDADSETRSRTTAGG